ncbi:hypothetical protein, conserved [Eimeria praecox]|uniref:Uncharacterized protein n=1 Tax=Eimeria praecox TaxID=51316 RepID=U6GTL2_9EIME|nr:hypothetical protein, conserved [Eimeria praecox]
MDFPSEGGSGDVERSSKCSKKRKAKKDKKASRKKKRDKYSASEEEDNHYQLDQFDQEDVDRLLSSLLQLSPQMETELLDVFKQLDSWGVVYLNDLDDIRLRKKLRHLFRALSVGEVESEQGKGWRKVLTCKMSLSKFVKRRCKELRPRLEVLSPPADVRPCETSERKEEQAAEESRFDAEEAERKAEEAVQRWRAEHDELQRLSAGSVLQGASEQETAPSDAKPKREEWMLVAPAYLRCLAPKDGPDAKRIQMLQQKKKDDEEAIRVRAIMEEWNKTRKIKSLRELKEEGVPEAHPVCK